ncbi:stalk domain-containing protein [Moorella naiadis]|uniref:stalk domain-containing protein n=1 Tax=Moorella naiadis (nom. illeg.) TaxID=3093670 RepID=UPI003D9CAEED
MKTRILAFLVSLVTLVFSFAVPSRAAGQTAIFTIGSTTYTVNGQQFSMDVAPYTKDGRTFVPVRYAALALGVTLENILYEDDKVTLIKGNKAVQLAIGSNVMLKNGNAIIMDVAPEIVNGRTMIPFRWIARALDAGVDWNPESQQVVISFSEGQSVIQTNPTTIINQLTVEVPQAPTGLYVKSIFPESVFNHYHITLSWNTVNDATAYRIYSTASWIPNNNFSFIETKINSYTGTYAGNLGRPGNWEFYVTAVNSAGESPPSQIIQVTPPPWGVNQENSSQTPSSGTSINNMTSPLTLPNATLPDATVGQPYSYTFNASGGTSPYTYQITQGAFPQGLTLSSNGTISGTPNIPGTYYFTVTVTDSAGATITNSFSINVQSNVVTLPPLSYPSNVEIIRNTYTWTYEGKQFSWTIDVPFSILEQEAFYQIPSLMRKQESIINALKSIFGAGITEEKVPNLLIHDRTSSQYISSVANILNQTAISQGYDLFHEAEFIASFVQSIPYRLVNENTEYPPQVIANGGDCINKSTLLAAILHSLNYPVCVLSFDSTPKGPHAATGIGLPWPTIPKDRSNLVYYSYKGINYYFCESTVPGWNIGVTWIPANYPNPKICPVS